MEFQRQDLPSKGSNSEKMVGIYSLTGREHDRNWRELTGQLSFRERAEQWADRNPRKLFGTALVLIALGIALIPPLISANNEADRVLRELDALRAFRGGVSVVPMPDSEATPIPTSEPSLQTSSPLNPLSRAYLELSIPTTEGKSVAEIMKDLGYKFYPPPHIPEVPDQFRAGDEGNYYRRLPLNWKERQFFDRFKTMNIAGSINAKEPFSSLIIQPIGSPMQGITEFFVVSDKGWVNIAQVNYNEVNLFIQDPGPEIMELINRYKFSPYGVRIVRVLSDGALDYGNGVIGPTTAQVVNANRVV